MKKKFLFLIIVILILTAIPIYAEGDVYNSSTSNTYNIIDTTEVEERLEKIREQMEKTRTVTLKGVTLEYGNNNSNSDFKLKDTVKFKEIDRFSDIVDNILEQEERKPFGGYIGYLLSENIYHRDDKITVEKVGQEVYTLDCDIDKLKYTNDGENIKKSELVMALMKNYEGIINSPALSVISVDNYAPIEKTLQKVSTGKSNSAVIDQDAYFDKENIGALGIDPAENDIYINWEKDKTIKFYLNPNIYSNYIVSAYNKGILRKEEFNTHSQVYKYCTNENYDNLWYRTTGIFKEKGNLDTSYPDIKLDREEDVAQSYSNLFGDKWIKTVTDDKVIFKSYDLVNSSIFSEEIMRPIDALKMIERFMRHYETDLSGIQQEAVIYKLSADISMLEEDESTISYLVARGIIDFEDPSELSGYYRSGPAFNAQINEWLYRLVNRDSRNIFNITLTDNEKTLKDLGYKETQVVVSGLMLDAFVETDIEPKYSHKFIFSSDILSDDGTLDYTIDNYDEWFISYQKEGYNIYHPGRKGIDYIVYLEGDTIVYAYTDEIYNLERMGDRVLYLNSSDGNDKPGIFINGASGLKPDKTYVKVSDIVDFTIKDSNYRNGQEVKTRAILVKDSEYAEEFSINYTFGGTKNSTVYLRFSIPDSLYDDIRDLGLQPVNNTFFAEDDDYLRKKSIKNATESKNFVNYSRNSEVKVKYLGDEYDENIFLFKSESDNVEETVDKLQDLVAVLLDDAWGNLEVITRRENTFLTPDETENIGKDLYISKKKLKELNILNVQDKILYEPSTEIYAFLYEDSNVAFVGNQVVFTETPLLKIEETDEIYYNLRIISKMLHPESVEGQLEKINEESLEEFSEVVNVTTTVKELESMSNSRFNLYSILDKTIADAGKLNDDMRVSLTHLTQSLNKIIISTEGINGLNKQLGYLEITFDWRVPDPSDINFNYSTDMLKNSNSYKDLLKFYYKKPTEETALAFWNTNMNVNNRILTSIFGKPEGKEGFGISGYMTPIFRLYSPGTEKPSVVVEFEDDVPTIQYNSIPEYSDRMRVLTLILKRLNLKVSDIDAEEQEGLARNLYSKVSDIIVQDMEYSSSNGVINISNTDKSIVGYRQGLYKDITVKNVKNMNTFTDENFLKVTDELEFHRNLFQVDSIPTIKNKMAKYSPESWYIRVNHAYLSDLFPSDEGKEDLGNYYITNIDNYGKITIEAEYTGSEGKERVKHTIYNGDYIVTSFVEDADNNIVSLSVMEQEISPFLYERLPLRGFMHSIALKSLHLDNLIPVSNLEKGSKVVIKSALSGGANSTIFTTIEKGKTVLNLNKESESLSNLLKTELGFEGGSEDKILLGSYMGIKEIFGTSLIEYSLDGSLLVFKTADKEYTLYPEVLEYKTGYLDELPIARREQFNVAQGLLDNVYIPHEYEITRDNISEDIDNYAKERQEQLIDNRMDWVFVILIGMSFFISLLLVIIYFTNRITAFNTIARNFEEDTGIDWVSIFSFGRLNLNSQVKGIPMLASIFISFTVMIVLMSIR